MPSNARFLQLSRKVHLYFGLFISPALLFFAFTGCYQTLGLHEPSSNYKPPALLASLGQIHKKQTYIVPVRRPAGQGGPEGARADGARPAGGRPADGGTAVARDGQEGRAHAPAVGAAPGAGAPQQAAPTLQSKQKQHLPLKIFFVIVSLGLFTSTLTGVYMAYKYDRNKVLVTGLLLAGVILPLILLRF